METGKIHLCKAKHKTIIIAQKKAAKSLILILVNQIFKIKNLMSLFKILIGIIKI